MRLESLPGVGPGLAAAIRRRFGDDARFFTAAGAADIEALTAVEGISERRAVELVQTVRGEASTQGFLATPGTRAVHERIIAAAQARAGTQHGRNRLRLLSPLSDPEQAMARSDHILAQKAHLADVDRDQVRRLLRAITSIQTPTPRCDTTRLVIAETPEAYERLHGLGIGKWNILGGRRDLALAGDMELVVIAYEEGMDAPDFDAVEEVSADAPLCDLSPAAVLAWAACNRRTLEGCAGLAAAMDRSSVAADILAALDGIEIPRVDADGLAKEVTRLHRQASQDVQAAMAGLQLSGTDLLGIMNGEALPKPVQAVIDDALKAARAELKQTTGFSIDPFLPGLPVAIDDDEVERAQRRIGADGRLRRERAEREAARRIAALQEPFCAEVAHWLEWDADFALASLAIDLDLQPWTIGDGFRVRQGIHMDLAMDPAAQRIDYHIDDAAVAILTGANSGGKSTLLEQVCQGVVMARLGLPVVGHDVQVPWVDEVHLVTARRGLDAGAFETFLRAFLPASRGDARRLVLADEVESVTELEAAGKILAFFIERLLQTDSLGIIVSHVPHAILEHLPATAVRVDGIEAKGLDDQHRLVVDRQPVMGRLARSTPELIVQRLAASTRGEDQALYAALAERLAS